MPYDPRPYAGQTLEGLSQHVREELQNVARSQSDTVDFIQLNVLHVEPKKPRDGMICYFDGTDFDPTTGGAGFYGRVGGAWVKL